MRTTPTPPRAFTLVELLVVIVIILIVSVAALPVVLPAIRHRQVSEAARILQGALAGARDSAIHNNAPAGIRLLPDPTLNGINPKTGLLDPAFPLAVNRIIPIEPAPDYSEGSVSIIKDPAGTVPFNNANGYFPYPAVQLTTSAGQTVTNGVLMVEECPINTQTGLPNAPTSWFWNIRIGEKIQIGNSGRAYTVVGPLGPLQLNAQQLSAYVTANNPDLYVNDGAPGTKPQLTRTYPTPNGPVTVQVEYLFLVNGLDDAPQDGFVDNLWGGNSSNDLDALTNQTIEFENETWQGVLGSLGVALNNGFVVPSPGVGLAYTITRNPVPSARGREVQLPSDVVIDLTTWATTRERSRIPLQAFNQATGSIDILVYPNGHAVPTVNYSTPASVGFSGSFFHLWLAERGDVTAPSTTAAAPYLPIGVIQQTPGQPPPYPGPRIKGEYRLVTVFTRNGQVVTNDNVPFDNPAAPRSGTYNASLPFLEAQQGVADQ